MVGLDLEPCLARLLAELPAPRDRRLLADLLLAGEAGVLQAQVDQPAGQN